MAEAVDSIRLDKWLWQARFFKSRRLAAEAAGGGITRVNGQRIAKPAHSVRPGDVVTFVAGRRTRVIRIETIGTRRGPATEAQSLYTDLDPLPPSSAPEHVEEDRGGPRPTKRQRREIDALRRGQP